MGKWYNHRIYLHYKESIKTVVDEELRMYLPHVANFANTFPRDSIAIGTLDLNDLIQAANEGFLLAWDKVDHLKDQAEKWTYLKNRIRWAIRREIDKYGSHIATPINRVENLRNELAKTGKFTNVDQILVSSFARFFDNQKFTEYIEDHEPWVAIQLEGLINDALDKYVANVDHRIILLKYYGVGYDKHSMRDLSEQYKKSENNIKQIVHETRNKLRNKEFEEIIENYYNLS